MIQISEEIRQALQDGRPVVALESTLISHGLPAPVNLETARAMEVVIRAGGAVPATVGIVEGQPVVGLSDQELGRFASDGGVLKASRRDLPVVVARAATASTTVAATLVIMERAGLRVLATGGIGGVHRDAEKTFDFSADLAELSRTTSLVVCSGAKSILDLPRTVELLETLGVTVLGYQTDTLPAFYASSSGLPVTARVDDAAEAAAVFRARAALDLPGATVLAVPPPAEVALTADEVAAELESALPEVAAAGVRGRDVTPYLLSRLAQQTAGRSVAANRALLVNNAGVAAAVAVELVGKGSPASSKEGSGA